jgi:serine/threonine-protein kinase
MATISVDKFVDVVRKSGLVEEDRLCAVLEEVPPAATTPGGRDSQTLAQALIDRKLLTVWQCERLIEGRYKGFILGKYKLLGLLGTGGMSSVYLAEHMLMQRRVAIKVLPRHKVEDSSYLARFRREAQAVAALDHRNIVRAYDIDNDGGTHYIVMEYVQGRDLNTIVKNDGPLDYDSAADYIRQAAEGLQHAHDAGLVHRDIKPANLLVDSRGTVKILDMGLARFTDEQQNSLTRMHDENVLGTADYLAPEQAKDSHAADHRADIYSLGCTLYYLLTGHPPFREGTLAQRIVKHQTEAPSSIYEDRPDAPQPLVDVCLRMMAKQPPARFQNASEVARVLGAWLAGRGKADSATAASRPAARPAPPPRRTPGQHQPGQRQPGAPDDTVSDKTRITIKGQPRGSSARLPKPGTPPSLPGAKPGASPASKPPSDLHRSAPAASRPGGSSVAGKPGSSKSRLPVAKAIDDAAKTKALETLAAMAGDPLSVSELKGNPLQIHAPKSSPQWLWWSVAAGATIVVAVIVILVLAQLG